jgi:hypothetical protein
MDNNKFQNKENEEARSNGLSVVVVGIFFFIVSDDLMSKDNNFWKKICYCNCNGKQRSYNMNRPI